MQATSIHNSVREHYAELARSSSACCGSNELYPDQLLTDLPAEVSAFTLGCGDPITLAQLKPGETVLDLGSGGGLDCFLASKQVGETGHVIGVDIARDHEEQMVHIEAHCPNFRFWLGDSVMAARGVYEAYGPCGLLFIDTTHTKERSIAELVSAEYRTLAVRSQIFTKSA